MHQRSMPVNIPMSRCSRHPVIVAARMKLTPPPPTKQTNNNNKKVVFVSQLSKQQLSSHSCLNVSTLYACLHSTVTIFLKPRCHCCSDDKIDTLPKKKKKKKSFCCPVAKAIVIIVELFRCENVPCLFVILPAVTSIPDASSLLLALIKFPSFFCFFSKLAFCADSYSCIRSTSVLLQQQVKNPCHSAKKKKSAKCRLQLNTHIYPRPNEEGKAQLILLSRHRVRTHQENKTTRNSSGNARPQSFQIVKPLWTDPSPKEWTAQSAQHLFVTCTNLFTGSHVCNISIQTLAFWT